MNLPNALQVNPRAAKVGKAFNYLGAKKGALVDAMVVAIRF